MSRRTRNPFAKISRFFKQRPDASHSTSSLSSANTPAEPASTLPLQSDAPTLGLPPVLQPPQTPTLSPSSPSSPPTPSLRAPSPAPPPPQPPTPLISQVPTSAIPPDTSPSAPSQPRPIDHGMLSPDLIALSQGYLSPPQQPPGPILPALTWDLARPSAPLPGAYGPTPQLGGSTFFSGAHGFNISNSQFNDFSPSGSGLKDLLKHSMPDAFYNSAARYPPPKCHLGTREEYITKIIDWALGNLDRCEPVLWMRGPFGIGKSAVAQSCAEILDARKKLGATLFFSRSNTDRDDPRRVFTSIAFQIATKCELFSEIIDARIRKDPSLITKSLSVQFNELLVHPLSQVGIAQSGIDGYVVIIDGLDECRGSPEQCEIIDIIAASAHQQTTPFRWFITSRPEEPIIQTMNSDAVSPVSFHLELPVSREIDHEILVYLVDEFSKIRKRHRLPDSWPTEQALSLLVDRTAGLWIYVTTIMRFIADSNSLGPRDQLRIVLEFAKNVSAKGRADNPLAEMDFFYTLIIGRVPLKIRVLLRKVLVLHSIFVPRCIPSVLGLSEEQFRHSCAFIQSVMELRGRGLQDMNFHFYHASFLDFMRDPARSKELCIFGDFLIEYRRERFDWLHQACSRSIGPSSTTFPSEPVLPEGKGQIEYYSYNVECFWRLCGVPDHPIDPRTAASLEKLPFGMMLQQMEDGHHYITRERVEDFRDNLPAEFRDRIIRNDKCPIPGCTNTKNVRIFGHGMNETVVADYSDGGLMLKNNQDPPPGQCFCGSRIKREGDTKSS